MPKYEHAVSEYHKSISKRVLDYFLAIAGIIFLIPLSLVLYLIFQFLSPGPLFFIQKRVGKNGKVFNIFKFRIMEVDSENERGKKYLEKLNISDGPVFKIPNDPRLTKIGKILRNTGMDELPQIMNVLKGDMSIVGPRPFPVYEANKLSTKQKVRELILPGITSMWVINGGHKLSFKKWMDLDKEYVENADFSLDVMIILNTLLFLKTLIIKPSK